MGAFAGLDVTKHTAGLMLGCPMGSESTCEVLKPQIAYIGIVYILTEGVGCPIKLIVQDGVCVMVLVCHSSARYGTHH